MTSGGHIIPAVEELTSSSASSVSLPADGADATAADDLAAINRRQISIKNLIIEGLEIHCSSS